MRLQTGIDQRLTALRLIALSLLWNGSIHAQQLSEDESLSAFYGDEDFISIATGNKKLIHRAPSVATVITARQIEEMGALTVAEALSTVPGLHVYPSPFNRLNQSFSLRGIHTDQNPQVLFLVNGLPVREEYTGARPQTLRLPVHAVSRIEVIRGPGSAVYGADAYSGVINVITKDVEDLGNGGGGLRYGSFNTLNGWLQTSFEQGNWRWGLMLDYLKSDGDDERIMARDLQSVFDELLGTQASRAPGSLATHYDIIDARLRLENAGFQANLWYWDNRDAGQGAGAAQALDPDGTQNTRIGQLDVSYTWHMGGWENTVRYSLFRVEDRAEFSVFPAGAVLPLGSDGNLVDNPVPTGLGLFTDGYRGNPQPTETLNAIDLVARYDYFHGHRLSFGVGGSQRRLTAREEKNFGPGVIDIDALMAAFAQGAPLVIDGSLTDVSGTQDIFVPNARREIFYLSLQDEWQFAYDWELTAGIRYDDYSDVGETLNPRLALVWQTTQSLTSKLLYGRAFRAPAFDSLYAQNNPSGVGNPNLDPETIDTSEAGINWQINPDNRLAMNLFYYEADDLIEFVPDVGATTKTAANHRAIRGHGLEAEYHWQYNTHQLALNYAWQDSEDRLTNRRVPLAPQQLLRVQQLWTLNDQLTWHARINWVGPRDREPLDPRPALSNFTTLDVAMHWTIAADHGVTLSLIANNLLDKQAAEPTYLLELQDLGPISDYPIPGRSLAAQLSIHY